MTGRPANGQQGIGANKRITNFEHSGNKIITNLQCSYIVKTFFVVLLMLVIGFFGMRARTQLQNWRIHVNALAAADRAAGTTRNNDELKKLLYTKPYGLPLDDTERELLEHAEATTATLVAQASPTPTAPVAARTPNPLDLPSYNKR